MSDPAPPSNVSVEITPETVALSWRSSSLGNLFAFAALLAATVFATQWALGTPGSLWPRALLLAAPVLAMYAVLVRLVNRTEVHANSERLRIRTIGLPWWGSETIAASGVREVRCDERPFVFLFPSRIGITALTSLGPVTLGELPLSHQDVANQVTEQMARLLHADAKTS